MHRKHVLVLSGVFVGFFTGACFHSGASGEEDASVDADADSDSDTDTDTDSDADTDADGDVCDQGGYDGVDLLVMVDDSMSMSEEQVLLGGAMFTLVDALLYSPAYDVDEIRVAVVSSNMGISFGENADVPDDSIVPASLLSSVANCEDRGDDGLFLGIALSSFESSAGTVSCSPMETAWADSTAMGSQFPAQAACLTQQGTGGCGWEQQLSSAARGLQRADQQAFLVDTHVLAVLLVTDEEDCSMEDAPGLFATAECLDPTKLNVACNANGNDQYLFAPDHFYDAFVAAKGDARAVAFAAIAGVPWAEQDAIGAAACEGRGDELGDCLDQSAMQMTTYVDDSAGVDITLFASVCQREEGGAIVTRAVPGRRYVSLAQEFGAQAYVSSICNEDWGPAMTALAALIGERVENACE